MVLVLMPELMRIPKAPATHSKTCQQLMRRHETT